MSIPSPAVLALSGWGYADFHVGVNFALTEFSEVRQELSKHHSFEGCVGLRERYIIPVGKANSLGEAEKELIVLWHGT